MFKISQFEFQNEYIVLLEERSNARSTLTDLSRKEVIMQEKNSKLQKEISALDHTVNVEVKRKIESLHGSILRCEIREHLMGSITVRLTSNLTGL